MYYVVMPKQRSVIAERIEDLLRIKGISVADLSRASGVKESSISNILSGVRKQPRSDTVQKIAKGFPTSVAYLNGDTSNPEPDDSLPMPEYTLELLEAVKGLRRPQRHQLLLIARSFVQNNEELRREFLRDMRDMIFEAADEAGRGEELDNFLEQLMNDANNGTDLPGPTDDDDDDGSGNKKTKND